MGFANVIVSLSLQRLLDDILSEQKKASHFAILFGPVHDSDDSGYVGVPVQLLNPFHWQ